MKKIRIIALLTTLLMVLSLFAGCTPKDSGKDSAGTGATSDATKASEPVTLTFFMSKGGLDQEFDTIKEEAEKTLKDIKIEWNLLPSDDADYVKMDVALMSGDTTDIVYLENANYQVKYANSGILIPLNSFAEDSGIDLEGRYGKFLDKYDGEKIYYLPYEVLMDLVFYNKKVFDDANVPYPTGDWTWDEYVETAKKLTDATKGIYGSFMYDWAYYFYMLAHMRKISAYNDDGTSNLDHPAFKESLKWYHDLGNVLKVQPGLPEIRTRNISWDGFMSGKYGRLYMGSWFLGVASDRTGYPRDWEIGVVAPPYLPDGKNMLSAMTCLGVNKNSKHQEEAFRVVSYVAETGYVYTGGMPARVDLEDADYEDLFKSLSESFNGEISTEDFKKAIVDNGLGVTPEWIAGPASAAINDAFAKEAEKYLFDSQSLDDTMNNIKAAADELLKQAQ